MIFGRAMGLSLLASASFARADLKLTVVVRLQNSGIPNALGDSLKGDPKASAEFRKDMDADPQTAMMMGMPVTLTQWFGEGKQRFDMGPATFLVTGGKSIGLDRKKKTFQAMPGDGESKLPNLTSLKMQDTGRTRKILGHVAREYLLSGSKAETKGVTVRFWATSDLPAVPTTADPICRQMPTAEQALMAKAKGLILRMEMTIPNGEPKPIVFTEQVVGISKEPIPATAFEVPNGYHAG